MWWSANKSLVLLERTMSLDFPPRVPDPSIVPCEEHDCLLCRVPHGYWEWYRPLWARCRLAWVDGEVQPVLAHVLGPKKYGPLK